MGGRATPEGVCILRYCCDQSHREDRAPVGKEK